MEEENKIYKKRIELFLKEKSFPGLILTKDEVIKSWEFTLGKRQKKVKEQVQRIENEIIFGFKHSFVVFESGILSTRHGEIFNFDSLRNFKIDKPKGFLSIEGYFTKENKHVDNQINLHDPDGKILKIFLFYLYGKRDKQIEESRLRREEKNKLREKYEIQRSKELKEIGEIISITEKLVDLSKKQDKLKSDNELKYKSILNEKLLNNLPNQTYGSVIFYNELNKNSTLFDNSHLNKITRFLNFIETHEDKYLGIYDRCVGLYIDDPNNNCFNELINKLETINHYYEIMKSLIHNVNKDKVLYNKLYNLIEDEGIFMTKTEKESLNYMKKVSTGIISLNNNIVDGFIHLSKGVNELTMINTEISTSLYDIDSSLGMINSSLDDIYFNLPDNRGR